MAATNVTFINDSANEQLDELLDLVVGQIQLTAAQRGKAEDRYMAVGEWLDAEDSPIRFLRPEIYSQGSLRIDTTVRPRQRIEFDLDLVCRLLAPAKTAPGVIYGLLWARMEASPHYRHLLERCPRCIRLNYADEFHLDIVPAIPDPAGSATSVFIPDRETRVWCSSNPKGYADWFEQQAALPRADGHTIIGGIEPLRAPEPAAGKPPLKLAVQLWKRQRDIAFDGRSELAPPSIVLTTIAALVYQKETHVTDALTGILIRTVEWARREVIRLVNPANMQESITDRWLAKPGAYEAFCRELEAFAARWQTLVARGTWPQLAKELEALFGESPVNGAVRLLAERRKQAREAGHLYASRATGTLAAAAGAGTVRVPKHTFHGGLRKR